MEIVFNAGHYLLLPSGGREEAHRHDWRVRATVEARELDEYGLVMDFRLLRRLLGRIVEPMRDAGTINEMPEFTANNPSTEHIARYIYDQLVPSLPSHTRLADIHLWETHDARAGYHLRNDW